MIDSNAGFRSRYWLLGLLLLARVATASVVMPDDGPYYRQRQNQTLYIYDESARDLMPGIISYNEAIRAMYDESFGWKLDEEMDLVLTSPRQQVTNAYATVIPNIKSVWFPGGAGGIDDFSSPSWARLLNAHEIAHLYQLNTKGSLNAGLKSVFGNAFIVYPLIWPIFIHPNYLLPTFLIEGNAVFNESRLNQGGRLHNGEDRALVLAQIKAGDIDPNRLINNEFKFPFGENPYLQGAYFQAHLAAKYGIDKTNQFFLKHGEHYFWPLILNKTFRAHFGSSYPQEIREYVRNMQALARNQQQTPGSPWIESTYVGALNHDAKSVTFLSTDVKETPILNVYDKESRTWTHRQLDLLMGKVFGDTANPLTAASYQHDLHHKEFSLYGTAAKMDPRYRGQVVTDQRAGKTVGLDGGHSWVDPRLLVNGEFYDVTHSTAILDEQGHVYYFRQNGAERILYRDRQPLTKFEGFYAKPLEVTADGTFYFIGNSDYGSTLYAFKGKEILRVLKSDRVVDARSIGNDQFLVVEVTNVGHSVLTAKAEVKSQAPAVYSYGFANRNVVSSPAAADAAPGSNANSAIRERPYNSLGQMRYSSLNFQSTLTSQGLSVLGLADFTDPLQYQSVTAGYAGSETGGRAALAEYQFTKYLPDFYARYSYQEDRWDRVSGLRQRAYDQDVTLGFRLPVLRWRRWDAAIGLGLLYEKDDTHEDPALYPPRPVGYEERYGTLSTFELQYQVAPGLGMMPWRSFKLNFTNKLEAVGGEWTKKYNTNLVQTSYTQGFPLEFYGTLAGNVAWSEYPDIEIQYEPYPLSQDIRIPRLTFHDDDYVVKSAGSLRFEATKVFNLQYYSPRIPIGLNRLAPFVVAQAIAMDDSHQDLYPANIFEWGYGVDLDLLVAHLASVQLRYLAAYDTRHPADRVDQVNLNYKHSF